MSAHCTVSCRTVHAFSLTVPLPAHTPEHQKEFLSLVRGICAGCPDGAVVPSCLPVVRQVFLEIYAVNIEV
eukprot:3424379-Prymnesium_polylepis.1